MYTTLVKRERNIQGIVADYVSRLDQLMLYGVEQGEKATFIEAERIIEDTERC
jgi:hypothetical protein